jgi:starch phosphorylase
MKVLVNGGLNLSELDGWWAEAYAPGVGWAVEGGAGESASPDAHDAADAAALYELLEREVVPCFYERDGRGIPRRWIERVRRSLRAICPRYNAGRMMREYVENAYRRR